MKMIHVDTAHSTPPIDGFAPPRLVGANVYVYMSDRQY